nr:hypothetical protein CFP56_17874 [Quercus suber]
MVGTRSVRTEVGVLIFKMWVRVITEATPRQCSFLLKVHTPMCAKVGNGWLYLFVLIETSISNDATVVAAFSLFG